MPVTTSFRQVDEKHVPFEVELMMWSPKMDLIAVVSVAGEVALHRLSWQKVWSLPPPNEGTKVLSLAWRPDGKLLAVGYSTNVVHLCNIENAACIHVLNTTSPPTFMSWSSESSSSEVSEEEVHSLHSASSLYLPKLPPFDKSYSEAAKPNGDDTAEDKLKLNEQNCLNLLVIGMESGHIELFAYGIVHVGTLDPEHFGLDNIGKVVSALLADDLSMLSVVVETRQTEYNDSAGLQLLTFDCSLLSTWSKELRTATLKLGRVLTLLMYMETTMSHMSEAWEDILLEMDSKLKKLAEDKYKVCSGSVSTDFFRLLMFGKPSDELRNFLLFTLTDKGLKKLGHSIESSYTNIQKLLLKHLVSVGQSLVYHLSDIRGLSLWQEKFGVIGLSQSAAHEAVKMAGSFMLKASELQQVIDASLKNFKAFFRWLYVAMQRLADEPIPSSLMKMSQQDLSFVAQFLHDNFMQDVAPHVAPHKSGFKLEKVGQYLKRQDLQKPDDNSGNPWQKLLAESTHLRDSPLLFAAHPNLSLIQVFDKLTESVSGVIDHCAKTIGASISASDKFLFTFKQPFSIRISQSSTAVNRTKYIQTAFAVSNEKQPEQFFICRQPIHATSNELELASLKCGLISVEQSSSENSQPSCQHHSILDLSFYDDKMLSLLLNESNQENGRPALILVPLTVLEADGLAAFRSIPTDSAYQPLDVSEIRDVVDVGGTIEAASFRTLENMKASKFAISGTRKVACVLFASRRRVRLFLMDVEDEDEDEANETCQAESRNDSREFTSGTEDNSLSVMVADDENKENSTSDTTDML